MLHYLLMIIILLYIVKLVLGNVLLECIEEVKMVPYELTSTLSIKKLICK